MIRAQCIVHKNSKLLLTKHRKDEDEWWCLPGGGIEDGETPQAAALRELKEECSVDGKVVARISHITYPRDSESYTYLIDIGDQEPRLGVDPEMTEPVLVAISWLSLREIPERDRVFLWWSGLTAVPAFLKEVESWGVNISYPDNSQKRGISSVTLS